MVTMLSFARVNGIRIIRRLQPGLGVRIRVHSGIEELIAEPEEPADAQDGGEDD
jgi:hypothetical protein